MKYAVSRAARHDIDGIAAFYAQEHRELGARFIEEVYRSLQLLQEYPHLGRRAGKSHRRFPLRGFPFLVNYRIDDANAVIRVIAISHQSRRPGYWADRVEEPYPQYAALPALFIYSNLVVKSPHAKRHHHRS